MTVAIRDLVRSVVGSVIRSVGLFAAGLVIGYYLDHSYVDVTPADGSLYVSGGGALAAIALLLWSVFQKWQIYRHPIC